MSPRLPIFGPRRRQPRPDDVPAPDPVAHLSDNDRRATHMLVALLLDYPAVRTAAEESQIDASIAALPLAVSTPLAEFRASATQMGADGLAEHYVRTFDLKRRCALYLTYYAAGDTRRRGMALVTFIEAFRAAGWTPEPDELPDYLPTVLELSARTGDPVADQLLASHRDGIEVLRVSLTDLRTPYAHLLDAICLTLPTIDEDTEARLVALINAGPPVETVGLTLAGEQVAHAPYPPSGIDMTEARR